MPKENKSGSFHKYRGIKDRAQSNLDLMLPKMTVQYQNPYGDDDSIITERAEPATIKKKEESSQSRESFRSEAESNSSLSSGNNDETKDIVNDSSKIFQTIQVKDWREYKQKSIMVSKSQAKLLAEKMLKMNKAPKLRR